MPPNRYRKKPVEIEAVRWGTPGAPTNPDPIIEWIRSGGAKAAYLTGGGETIAITTLEGVMSAKPGDWIIRDVQGEFYPCKPDIFAATYDPVDVVMPVIVHSAQEPERIPILSAGDRIGFRDHTGQLYVSTCLDITPNLLVLDQITAILAVTPVDQALQTHVDELTNPPTGDR